MYEVKARYYAGADQTGESLVITSDNSQRDTRLEVGKKVALVSLEEIKGFKTTLEVARNALKSGRIETVENRLNLALDLLMARNNSE